MLRNVILMSSSGILMFSKEFVSSVAQVRGAAPRVKSGCQ